MRILHIDTGKEWRGGQRQAKILHDGLLASGIESFFLANKDGALFEKLDPKNRIPLTYGGEFSLNTHRQVAKIIAEIKPDIIQTHDGHAVIFGAWHKNGAKLIETRRVSYPISRLSRTVKYSLVDRHIAVSQDTANYLQRFFPDVTVIHSCIQNSRFADKTIPAPFEREDKTHLLFVGAFSTQKGIDVLIHAFTKVFQEKPDTHLHLVGDGKLLDAMEELVRESNLERAVTFHGRRDDVERFYIHSDIVIVPSVDGEGSSGVIKEGIAAGKFVVASDLEANKELINDLKNGLFFTSRDSDDLAKKTLQLIHNPAMLSLDAIAQKARTFDCSFLIENYISTYRQILEE